MRRETVEGIGGSAACDSSHTTGERFNPGPELLARRFEIRKPDDGTYLSPNRPVSRMLNKLIG
jgi:hypothetical protein